MTIEEILSTIFKGRVDEYDLTEFKNLDKQANEILEIEKENSNSDKYFLKTLAPFYSKKEKVQVYSSQSGGKSAPEEIIRQLWVYKLINEYNYSKEHIKLEVPVSFGGDINTKHADMVIYSDKSNQNPKIVVETKSPKRRDGIDQLKSYLNALGAEIGIWSNGSETIILYRKKGQDYETLSRIPKLNQTIEDLRKEVFTIDSLEVKHNFKKTIQELEELVLADSGADEFNEIFKLIFCKILDEKESIHKNNKNKELEFRQQSTPKDTYKRISELFDKAKNEWRGIFKNDEKIELRPEHLHVCVGSLERKRLLGSNLRIIDDAFEYLIPSESKKKKGQFFTPRYVIDMCVRMINPKETEYIIDPSCGSAGFLLHSMEWCYPIQDDAELDTRKWNYASKFLYGIDLETRAVKAAKSLMLIAGDGHTNIYGPEVSSIDPKTWLDTLSGRDLKLNLQKNGLLKNEPDEKIDILRDDIWNYYRELQFDIVLSNPPFAGEIKDKELLSEYNLAKPALQRAKNKQAKEERDVLFIERIIDMLKPKGRAAIVLPQGKLNNSSLAFIRDYIFSKTRLLAVVSLHSNTFKPHTGVKTSVIIIQKYSEEELKKINDIKKKVSRNIPNYKKIIEDIISNGDEEVELDIIPEEILSFMNDYFENELIDDNEIDEEKINDSIADLNEEIEKLHLDLVKVREAEEIKEEIKSLKEEKKSYTKNKDKENVTRTSKKLQSLEEELKKAKEAQKTNKDILKSIKNLEEQVDGFIYKQNLFSNKGKLSIIMDSEDLLLGLRDRYILKETASQLNYPIFMAVSDVGGKDSSGNYTYQKDENGNILTNSNGDFIIAQDLVNYNISKEELKDIEAIPNENICIAEAFIKFAKEQKIDFWE
ncbi:N-6 DNA methylase [Campylobacter sp. CCUG 57310]|uniref:N-6 DNA methylase n=1 Tax=Campylobacter sp. CCUG 57310 TaxID=2517362 RepID=UPI001562EC5C|nr:N-6 DNA methylase [Campylobacter sp. CCUG 57310]QKF91589.1 type IIB restriction/modification system, restriction/methyltransferase subunit [Campylobacter sp. CCUG 57310]